MNIRLLRRIQEKILAEPENFNMRTWTCGTAHCIGGWACVLSGKVEEDTSVIEMEDLLGMDDDSLFFTDTWDYPYGQDYEQARTLKDRAQIASNYIDHLIDIESKKK